MKTLLLIMMAIALSSASMNVSWGDENKTSCGQKNVDCPLKNPGVVQTKKKAVKCDSKTEKCDDEQAAKAETSAGKTH